MLQMSLQQAAKTCVNARRYVHVCGCYFLFFRSWLHGVPGIVACEMVMQHYMCIELQHGYIWIAWMQIDGNSCMV